MIWYDIKGGPTLNPEWAANPLIFKKKILITIIFMRLFPLKFQLCPQIGKVKTKICF